MSSFFGTAVAFALRLIPFLASIHVIESDVVAVVVGLLVGRAIFTTTASWLESERRLVAAVRLKSGEWKFFHGRREDLTHDRGYL